MQAVLDKPILKGNPGVIVGKDVTAAIVTDDGIHEVTIKVAPEVFAAQMRFVKLTEAEAHLEMKKAHDYQVNSYQALMFAPPATPEMLADRKRQALEWVNALRTEWGHPALEELPKGRQHASGDCVIARALPRECRVGRVVRFAGGQLPLPAQVCEFVLHFDHGYYPELVA